MEGMEGVKDFVTTEHKVVDDPRKLFSSQTNYFFAVKLACLLHVEKYTLIKNDLVKKQKSENAEEKVL